VRVGEIGEIVVDRTEEVGESVRSIRMPEGFEVKESIEFL